MSVPLWIEANIILHAEDLHREYSAVLAELIQESKNITVLLNRAGLSPCWRLEKTILYPAIQKILQDDA